MLFAPPVSPVSFSREVAPIMAMYCNTCHGDAGGLNTRSYREIILGGNLGKVILPGEPDGSLLIHFVDGRRGTAHRMPKGGRPLSSGEIESLRLWLDECQEGDTLSAQLAS